MARLPAQYCREDLWSSIAAVYALEKILGEDMMCMLSDAVQCFANHPDWHTCDEDLDKAAIFALCLNMAGFNHVKDEYNILKSWTFPQDA